MIKKIFIPFFLFLWPIILVFIAHPAVFGNSIDWYSQHVMLGQTLRDTMIANRQLVCDFVPQLFGGINFFALSYYGVLRPDVLLGALFPQLDFAWILSAYAIFLMGLGCIASFFFLKQNGFSDWICIVLSLMLPCSTIYFQSHRQIMFVNFIPFLFGMLIGIDRLLANRKSGLLILCGVLLVLHSFYFAPASFLVALVYFTFKKGWKNAGKPFVLDLIVIVLLTAMLWLPTGLVLLENKRASVPVDLFSLFRPDRKLTGLLYGRYGCGQPLLAWIGLILGLFSKRTRKLSILLLVFFLFPFFWYVLSGFLYARTKALIPLLPLVLLLEAYALQKMKEVSLFWLTALILIWPLLTIRNTIIVWDACFCLLLALIFSRQIQILGVLLIPSLMVWNTQNPSNSYLNTLPKPSAVEQWVEKHPDSSIAILDSDDLVNDTFDLRAFRSSGYSSIYPKRYNEFIFDELRNNIPINNRTAILDSCNPFYLQLCSIDTIQSEKAPYGYMRKDDGLLHKDSILPRFRITYDWMSEKDLDALSFPDRLQAMIETPSVSNIPKTNPQFINQWKEESFSSLDQVISTRKKQTFDNIHLDPDRITVLEMDIENKDPEIPVVIDINGIRNKLSSISSVYYNHNTHFTFFFSGEYADFPLQMDCHEGNYVIKNTSWHSIDASILDHCAKKTDPIQVKENKNSWSLSATLSEDGILYTPFSMQNGFSIEVDHKQVPLLRVNKTFVGCKLSKGSHQVVIRFEAPGKRTGILLSGIGAIGFFIITKRRKT